jgi:hypothetical protein
LAYDVPGLEFTRHVIPGRSRFFTFSWTDLAFIYFAFSPLGALRRRLDFHDDRRSAPSGDLF